MIIQYGSVLFFISIFLVDCKKEKTSKSSDVITTFTDDEISKTKTTLPSPVDVASLIPSHFILKKKSPKLKKTAAEENKRSNKKLRSGTTEKASLNAVIKEQDVLKGTPKSLKINSNKPSPKSNTSSNIHSENRSKPRKAKDPDEASESFDRKSKSMFDSANYSDDDDFEDDGPYIVVEGTAVSDTAVNVKSTSIAIATTVSSHLPNNEIETATLIPSEEDKLSSKALPSSSPTTTTTTRQSRKFHARKMSESSAKVNLYYSLPSIILNIFVIAALIL